MNIKTFLENLEVRTREDGSTYVTQKDNAPEWVSDLCYKAHDGMMPNDWSYRLIYHAAERLADTDPEHWDAYEIADDLVSIYTADLLNWASSNLSRLDYCDQALDECLASPDARMHERLATGQYVEISQIVRTLISAFE